MLGLRSPALNFLSLFSGITIEDCPCLLQIGITPPAFEGTSICTSPFDCSGYQIIFLVEKLLSNINLFHVSFRLKLLARETIK